jgi:hypothetical protein
MTHKEFKLVVKNEILELGTGYNVSAPEYKVGDIMTVKEDVFNKLKSGEDVEMYTSEGYIKFNKSNFENEVEVTIVTIEHDVRKLGNKK